MVSILHSSQLKPIIFISEPPRFCRTIESSSHLSEYTVIAVRWKLIFLSRRSFIAESAIVNVRVQWEEVCRLKLQMSLARPFNQWSIMTQ